MASTTAYPRSEGERFATDKTLTVVSCATCHVTYAIPTSFQRAAVAYPGDRGWTIHCPFGHAWHYTGKSVEQKLQEATERAGRLAAERDQAEAAVRAQKARGTRYKNDRDRERKRAAAGVCPCCNRTFQQLARHMASQHPEHGHTEADDAR